MRFLRVLSSPKPFEHISRLIKRTFRGNQSALQHRQTAKYLTDHPTDEIKTSFPAVYVEFYFVVVYSGVRCTL